MNTSLSLESLGTVLLLGVAAALVHMMFQLGVSVLTLLSGHSLGAKKAHLRLLHLNWSYIVGVYIAIILISLGIQSLIELLALSDTTMWILVTIITACIGLLVCRVYYRRSKGTILWLPRSIATYLTARAKKTRYGIEAGALGAMTVIAELPFIVAPLLIINLLLRAETREFQIVTLAIYAFVVTIPLLVITTMIGSGHRLSTIQRWREDNKTFLQYSAGVGLIILSLYLFAFHILGVQS